MDFDVTDKSIQEAFKAQEQALVLAQRIALELEEDRPVLLRFIRCTLAAFTQSFQATSASHDGTENAFGELRELLRAYISDEDRATEHPFYEELHQYMERRKLPKDVRLIESYCVGLAHPFMRHSLLEYYDQTVKLHGTNMEACGVPEAFMALSVHIGLDKTVLLYDLLAGGYTVLVPATIYLQGMTEHLAMSLQYEYEDSDSPLDQLLTGKI